LAVLAEIVGVLGRWGGNAVDDVSTWELGPVPATLVAATRTSTVDCTASSGDVQLFTPAAIGTAAQVPSTKRHSSE
jgi:hypothetical protein